MKVMEHPSTLLSCLYRLFQPPNTCDNSNRSEASAVRHIRLACKPTTAGGQKVGRPSPPPASAFVGPHLVFALLLWFGRCHCDCRRAYAFACGFYQFAEPHSLIDRRPRACKESEVAANVDQTIWNVPCTFEDLQTPGLNFQLKPLSELVHVMWSWSWTGRPATAGLAASWLRSDRFGGSIGDYVGSAPPQ